MGVVMGCPITTPMYIIIIKKIWWELSSTPYPPPVEDFAVGLLMLACVLPTHVCHLVLRDHGLRDSTSTQYLYHSYCV